MPTREQLYLMWESDLEFGFRKEQPQRNKWKGIEIGTVEIDEEKQKQIKIMPIETDKEKKMETERITRDMVKWLSQLSHKE